ncbi:MAG: ATP-binding protein, partial [Verrucomicrobiales bacterium]|nr:ATP-binding protein [Verrucomicrobiales bacterium]
FRRFSVLDGLWHDEIQAVCARRTGDVWVGTLAGLNRISQNRIHKVPHLRSGYGSSSIINALCEDDSGSVWIGTTAGLFRWNSASGEFEDHHRAYAWTNGPGIMRIVAPEHGTLWAEGEGLYKKNGEDWRELEAFRSTLTEASAYALLVDRVGAAWIGGEAGLWRFRQGVAAAFINAHEDSALRVNCLVEDREGNLWIGTDGGVSRWHNGNLATHAITAHLLNSGVRSLHEDRSGALWIGTGDLLESWQHERLTSHRWSAIPTHNKVRVVTSDCAGNVWVGRPSGLMLWRNGRWRHFTTADGLPSNDVRAILEDRNGNLWLGTAGGGLCRLSWISSTNDRRGEQTDPLTSALSVQTFNAADGLSNTNVWALDEDADGVLWIGTERGLNRLSLSSPNEDRAGGSSRIRSFTTHQGLFDDLVNEVLEDDFGRLWISCDRGIYRVAKNELKDVAAGRKSSVQCVAYDETDGLLSAETNGQASQPAGLKTSDGRLWFPTKRGVVVIDPANLRDNNVPPPVVIEQVIANGDTVFDSTVHGASAVNTKLGPGRAQLLEIRYTGNCLSVPEKVRFKYRLEGHDKEWIDAGPRRVAFYTGLPPGSYRFQVIAANQHGVWNESGAAFALAITPHTYQTLWFRVACAAGFAGILWFGARWRSRIHRLEHEAALARERERIARDMHDDIGSRLNQIALLSDVDRTPASQAPPLAELARDAARSLNEIVWTVHPGKDRLDQLAEFISQFALEYLGAAGVSLRIDFPEKLPPWPLSSQQRHDLFLAAKEALCNIVKHARATAVELRLRLDGPVWILEITDNGCGLANEPNRAGEHLSNCPSGRNGLENMRRRAESAGGELQIKSLPGQGTTVSFVLGRREPAGETKE